MEMRVLRNGAETSSSASSNCAAVKFRRSDLVVAVRAQERRRRRGRRIWDVRMAPSFGHVPALYASFAAIRKHCVLAAHPIELAPVSRSPFCGAFTKRRCGGGKAIRQTILVLKVIVPVRCMVRTCREFADLVRGRNFHHFCSLLEPGRCVGDGFSPRLQLARAIVSRSRVSVRPLARLVSTACR